MTAKGRETVKGASIDLHDAEVLLGAGELLVRPGLEGVPPHGCFLQEIAACAPAFVRALVEARALAAARERLRRVCCRDHASPSAATAALRAEAHRALVEAGGQDLLAERDRRGS